MTQEQGNILVVDDDRAMRTTLVANLEDQGHRLNACGSGKEAIGLIQQDAPDLVISDLRLPDLGGLDVLHALKEQRAEAAFILVTGYATVDTAVEALNEGAYAYITKPFNMDQVHSVIRNALLQQRLVRENRRLVASLQESNKELNTEVGQRKKAEEALQNSLERVSAAYEQSTIYAQELRDEIDQRTRAEAALVRSEELRRLQVAQEAKDQERKRLAEELHDETLAELTSFIVDLGLLSRSPTELPPDLRQILDELRERVRLAENGLRRIVQGLFPSVLTNLGLLPAIRSFMKEVADRPISNPTPVELELRATGLDGVRLPEEVEIAVYRVAQQGLVNALQHAHPRALLLELDWRGKVFSIRIADDGDGFDLGSLGQTATSGHFGLVNLRDRVEVLNGTLEIETAPSAGTTLLATIPTDPEAPASPSSHRSTYILRNRDPVGAAKKQ